ncbi:MAG: hypothetical protein A2Y10_11320 [Planctomycetes bacterium GWF2_41_51]|nr:MAG: hypothetical protein A2Y10_11320 [Planctomycetes bacterium GWF2_41_51]HBG26886.1 hypothetical protein [Phycisphaerales bacterium]
MKNKRFIIFSAVLILCSVSFANVLDNGSFEIPVVPQGSNFIEFPVIPAWTIENSIYYVVFKELGFTPIDGLNELYLFGGTATQNVGIIKADTVYNLNFAAGVVEGQTPIYSEIVLMSKYTEGETVYIDRLAAINLGEVITAGNQFFYGNLQFDSSMYPHCAGRELLVRIVSESWLHFDDFTLDAFMETPASGSTIGRGDFAGLSWTLPDPRIETDTVTCNVYFGENAQNLAQVISTQAATSYLPTIEQNKTYYWRIDVIDPSLNSGNPIKGRLMSFSVMDDCSFDKLQSDYYPVVGDLNGDCTVNFADFAILAQNWTANN